MKSFAFRLCFTLLVTASLCAGAAVAQSSGAPSQDKSSAAPTASTQTTSTPGTVAPDSATAASGTGQSADQTPATDPLKRQLSDKQKKTNAKKLKVELSQTYKKWLNEDVRYIITPEEESAFKQLSNDEERDQFIEQFWLRRDPTPDTPENEFKEEHYRRIAYANEHFAAGKAGWRTDRGRIYIIHGPADEVESHPSGGTYDRDMSEGGGTTSTYPFERWRYRYLVGQNEVILEFVDSCQCGDYHLTTDPNEKDALLHVPGAGLTIAEANGLANKSTRITGLGTTVGPTGQVDNTKEFDPLILMAKVNAPPPVKFKDLEELVSHKINVNLMPFDIRTDFVKVTGDTVLVPVTLQVKNKDITFVNKDGVQRGTVNIFGRVTGLTGRVAQTFEDTVQVDVPPELLAQTQEHSSLYWKAIPLRPGRYRFDVVVKDINGDRVGTWSHGVMVPEFNEDKLASSSLILADALEKVATKNVGAGAFVIGQTKIVHPHVEPANGSPVTFKRDRRMNLWMQVYNMQMDEQTKKPSAQIEYEIVNMADNKPVLHASETSESMGNLGDQMTLEKSLNLNSFQPGVYKLTVKINDNVSKQQIAPSVRFTVEDSSTAAQTAAVKPGS
jgi:GWxTD domain-containing protein